MKWMFFECPYSADFPRSTTYAKSSPQTVRLLTKESLEDISSSQFNLLYKLLYTKAVSDMVKGYCFLHIYLTIYEKAFPDCWYLKKIQRSGGKVSLIPDSSPVFKCLITNRLPWSLYMCVGRARYALLYYVLSSVFNDENLNQTKSVGTSKLNYLNYLKKRRITMITKNS